LAQQALRSRHFPAVASIARLIRSRFPEEPEPQRLLALTAYGHESAYPLDAEYYCLLGEAHRLFGEGELAKAHYRQALSLDRNFVRAHIGLATLRLTGEDYLAWLARLYTTLAPETVIEIGVFEGQSLALVRPPTRAIGIDPNPRVVHPLATETHIFPESSDGFFARRVLDPLLNGRPLGVGFIDGLHTYEQVLKDFIHLEAYCGPRSLILFHDTFPLDEATQSRRCDTQFHTGDVWKVVPCLKHYRPDLDVFTIATPWTGLTMVAGLNPMSQILANRYDEAVDRFIDMPYSAIEADMERTLNVVPNDWDSVIVRLRTHKVL
jgi:hypothetical protein